MENLLLTIAGAIITILLGVNGYFMKKWIESTEALTGSVNALKTTVALLQQDNGNTEKMCRSKHLIIDRKLNDHEEKLVEHVEAITALRAASKKRVYVKKSN